MKRAPATSSNEPQPIVEPTVAYRRRLMPWSSCRVPKKFRGEPRKQMEMWNDLASCLLAELAVLREQDPCLAFERLIVVGKVTRVGFPPDFLFDTESDDPVVKAVPDYLRAISASRSDSLVPDLYAALTCQTLDVSTVPADMFDLLSHADRAALFERLASIEPESNEGKRLRPVVDHIVMSEPDIDRFIKMLDTVDLWGFVDAARALDRLMTGDRYVTCFPFLVLRAVLEDKADKGDGDLLATAIAFCETHGKADVAQGLRQRMFHEKLSVEYARDWLRNLAGGRDARAEEENLLVCVRSDPRRGRALLFLLEWPSLEDAIRLARSLHDEMDDIEAWQLKKASKQLEDVAPDAALKLYRKSDNIRLTSQNVFQLRPVKNTRVR